MRGHGNRDTGKDRLTTISANLSDSRKAYLNMLAARKQMTIGKMVQRAIEEVYGKELDALERALLSTDLQTSEQIN